MPIDTYVAFGGVALLGIVGFFAAWFSHSKSELSSVKDSTSKEHQRTKKKIAAEIAEVEEKLHDVSAQIDNL
jgi:hypothetical protein